MHAYARPRRTWTRWERLSAATIAIAAIISMAGVNGTLAEDASSKIRDLGGDDHGAADAGRILAGVVVIIIVGAFVVNATAEGHISGLTALVLGFLGVVLAAALMMDLMPGGATRRASRRRR